MYLIASLAIIIAVTSTANAQDVPHDLRFEALQSLSDSSDAATEDVRRLEVPDDFVAAPWYPTPHGGWTPDWAVSYAKAASLVGNMTLAEKAVRPAFTARFEYS